MIPEPVNTTEKYLYLMVVKLDALTQIMASFMDAYTNKVENKNFDVVEPNRKKIKRI